MGILAAIFGRGESQSCLTCILDKYSRHSRAKVLKDILHEAEELKGSIYVDADKIVIKTVQGEFLPKTVSPELLSEPILYMTDLKLGRFPDGYTVEQAKDYFVLETS